MADIQGIVFNKEAFNNHMKRKANAWKPSMVNLGPDFAVYQFDNIFELNQAYDDAREINKYYRYGIDIDRPRKRFVIINPQPV